MKSILTVISLLFFNYYFGQNDIEIEIINDTIKKVSSFDQNNVVYAITNNSEKNYLLILDDTEFNEDPDYKVEPFFIGLPDYYIYEKNILLTPMFSFGARSTNIISKIEVTSKEFKKFHKQFAAIFDEYEMEIAYRISKKIVNLKPKEKKIFVTKVNFPNYKGRYFNLKNKSNYFFQISLQNSNEDISKYYKVITNTSEKVFSVFTGQIYSNKIPLVYEIYNSQ